MTAIGLVINPDKSEMILLPTVPEYEIYLFAFLVDLSGTKGLFSDKIKFFVSPLISCSL